MKDLKKLRKAELKHGKDLDRYDEIPYRY
jgi:hypothetical protein